MKKFFAILMTSALLLSACSHSNDSNDKNENNTKQTSQTNKSDDNQQKHKKVIKDGRTYVDGILIVNKDLGLPSNYNPGELIQNKWLQKLSYSSSTIPSLCCTRW